MNPHDAHRDLELIAATVHELKTPISLIHGMSAMLESDSHGELNSSQREQIRHIQKATGRLNALIDSLLHVENLPYSQHRQPVQLNSELEKASKQLNGDIQERKITLSTRVVKNLPPVLADPASVYQILSHTLNAAIKYTPQASVINLRTFRRGGMSVFQVETPGELIRPKEAKQISSSLGRHLQPVRSQGNSSGLNWYIVKSIVEFYQGSFRVSSVTRGTIITIKLPMSNQLSLFT